MKKLYVSALFCIGMATSLFAHDIVDEILVVVYHADGTGIITRSDIKPSIDGQPRSLRSLVMEELMLYDAERLHLEVTQDDAKRFLEIVQKENGLSQDQIKSLFDQLNYTYDEGIEQFRRRQIIDRIIDYRVKSDKRFIVTMQDVEAYNNSNPEYQEAQYTLQQGFVPSQHMGGDEVDRLIETDTIHDAITWEDPFTVADAELADSMRFIAEYEDGSIVDKESYDDGIELTRLAKKEPKKKMSAEDRYDEISQMLMKERFETLVNEYEDKLFRDSRVRFTYSEDDSLVRDKSSS
jgi:hypothetical protein